MGVPWGRSQNSVSNNRIIVCRLPRGFHIAGLSISAELGPLVELVHHVGEPRQDLFRTWVVPLVALRQEPADDSGRGAGGGMAGRADRDGSWAATRDSWAANSRIKRTNSRR